MLDVVLKMTHEHQITGLIPAIVQGVVINVAEDGAGTDSISPVPGIDVLAETLHQYGRIFSFVLSLVLF